MPKLVWTTPDGRQEHEFQAEIRIGRGMESDIQLLDPLASTLHATVSLQDGSWFVEDNGSTNGTLINGDRLSRSMLRDGDVITIGHVRLTFGGSIPAVPTTMFFGKGGGAPAAGRDTAITLKPEDILSGVFRDDGKVGQAKTSSVKASLDSVEQTKADASVLARRLEASYKISKAAAAVLDLPELMDRVLAALFDIFGAAERAYILLSDPGTGEVHSAAVRRRVPNDAEEITMSRTALQQAMAEREAILCTDALSDARYSDARSVVSLGIRSMMIAPLVFHDQVLGAIYVDTRHGSGRFGQPDLELLTVAAGQVAGCVAIARLHEQVVTSERLAAVGQTVAGLTHCIKNILQGIKGGVYIVDSGLDKGNMDGVLSGWEMVKRNNTFMEDLVFDLLSFSKERVPNYSPTDLNELCGEVCQLAAARADLKGVRVIVDADPDLATVELDSTGIRRCLLNLVMNAVDACEESKGTVTVATEPLRDGVVRVCVSDTGCGMSEEVKAKLFTVFFSTKSAKGTGLGLPVVKKIIEEHGGRIEVTSQEGEGTTFTVCLPPAPERKAGDDDAAGEAGADH